MRAAAPPEFSDLVERWGPILSALVVLAAWELLSRTGVISTCTWDSPRAV